jgi:GDPmannose 4,6-dehydratase
MKTALITGVAGQDGAYLAKFLLGKRYKVFGGDHIPNFWRLYYLGIHDKVELLPLDVLDSKSISEALISSTPNEVYHLAAQSFVGASFVQPLYTSEVTGLGTVRLLDEILKFNKKIKFYQASSSEMFGEDSSPNKNEKSAFKPVSPYAISKLYAYWMTRAYRKGYGMHASNGILFNHESPLRGLDFVTRKISNGVARISLGLSKSLKLGNLNSKRDWGYAPEYVEGMWKMLQQKNPDDCILATNETHTVREFVNEACKIAGISTTKIETDKQYLRPIDVQYLRGDYSKAKKKLGWSPKTKFKKLVKIMVEEDLNRWERWMKGEYFSWDVVTSGRDSIVRKKNKNL